MSNNFKFSHPLDITIGNGRIVWRDSPGQQGWALPGGGHTTNETEARHAASIIDRLIDGKV